MPTTFDPTVPDPNARSVMDERASHRAQRARVAARTMQVINYLFGALYVLIGFEFVLEVFAARDGNSVKRLLDALTDPFLGPFRTLLPTFSVGGSQVIFSYIVALFVYAMLHLGAYRLATIIARPRDAL